MKYKMQGFLEPTTVVDNISGYTRKLLSKDYNKNGGKE